jgi:hypothetical protein
MHVSKYHLTYVVTGTAVINFLTSINLNWENKPKTNYIILNGLSAFNSLLNYINNFSLLLKGKISQGLHHHPLSAQEDMITIPPLQSLLPSCLECTLSHIDLPLIHPTVLFPFTTGLLTFWKSTSHLDVLPFSYFRATLLFFEISVAWPSSSEKLLLHLPSLVYHAFPFILLKVIILCLYNSLINFIFPISWDKIP